MIPYIETHIEDACNLKCRGCSHFSGLAKSNPKDIADFDKEFERLAQLWKIPIIRIMGGEPLLNPNFMEYIRIAKKRFPDSRVSLVTNGTLMDKLVPYIDEINELSVDVTVSEYHLGNADLNVLNRITKHHIHEKGEMYNVCLDLDGMNDESEMFDRCDLHQNRWFYFQDGKLYHCCVEGNIDTFRKRFFAYSLPNRDSLGISVFDNTKEQIEAFLRQPSDLCKCCRTDIRPETYAPHSVSKGDISEWICR